MGILHKMGEAAKSVFAKKKKKGSIDMMGILSIVGGILLIGGAVAMAILFLDKFAQVDGISVSAQTAINDTRDAVSGVIDWFDIIVLFGVLASFIVGGVMIWAYFKRAGGSR